jgi:hypothetical protein
VPPTRPPIICRGVAVRKARFTGFHKMQNPATDVLTGLLIKLGNLR